MLLSFGQVAYAEAYTALSSSVPYTILMGDKIYQCPAGKVLNSDLSNIGTVSAYCGAGKIIPQSIVIAGTKAAITGVGYTFSCEQAVCTTLMLASVTPKLDGSGSPAVEGRTDAIYPWCTVTPPARCGVIAPDRTGETITAVTSGVTYVTGRGYSYTCAAGACTAPVSSTLTPPTTTPPTTTPPATGGTDTDPLSTVACANLTTNLRYGDKDSATLNDVSTLQDFLNSKSYLASSPTGFFGRQTFAAVKAFQSANNISPTGFVGVVTRAKIKAIDCAS